MHVQEIIIKLIKVLKDPKSGTDQKWEKVKDAGSLIRNYTTNQIQENTTYEVVALLLDLYLNLQSSQANTNRRALEDLATAARAKDLERLTPLAKEMPQLIQNSVRTPAFIFTGLGHAEAVGAVQILQWACHAIILFHDQRRHAAQHTQSNH